MKSTPYDSLTVHAGTSTNQVPDESAEFDWIQISETPC
jgi:hypothetical protein